MEASPSPVVMHPVPSNSAYQPLTPQSSKLSPFYPLSDSDDESDLSELSDAANLSDDSYDSDDSEDDMPLTEGELAEMESFGKEYDGPKLTPDQASRLLILMGHAQTCPGRYVVPVDSPSSFLIQKLTYIFPGTCRRVTAIAVIV
jgi:hypothetical protein